MKKPKNETEGPVGLASVLHTGEYLISENLYRFLTPQLRHAADMVVFVSSVKKWLPEPCNKPESIQMTLELVTTTNILVWLESSCSVGLDRLFCTGNRADDGVFHYSQ